jgi:hypothetical protein
VKNKLTDLNDHLFAQLERLSEEGLSQEDIAKEIDRSRAMVEVADAIISNADLQFRAVKLAADHGAKVIPHLTMLPAAKREPQS